MLLTKNSVSFLLAVAFYPASSSTVAKCVPAGCVLPSHAILHAMWGSRRSTRKLARLAAARGGTCNSVGSAHRLEYAHHTMRGYRMSGYCPRMLEMIPVDAYSTSIIIMHAYNSQSYAKA